MIDVSNFDHWFTMMSFFHKDDSDIDKELEIIAHTMAVYMLKESKPDVAYEVIISKVKQQIISNEQLLSLKLSPNLKRLGEIHQSLSKKLLRKLENIS